MTDETGRRCAQESIDIIIMKNNYNYLFIIKIILILISYQTLTSARLTLKVEEEYGVETTTRR